MKAQVTVIGSGISGLSIAQLLAKDYEVTVFEKESLPGGLLKCKLVNDNLFHLVGGHVFNTHNPAVDNWYWSFFERDKEFVKSSRNAQILLRNKLVSYPIENCLYMLGNEAVERTVEHILRHNHDSPPSSASLEEYLLHQFGDYLYHLYFKPYNEKLWRTNLTTIPLAWLAGKLPMPSSKKILCRNILREEDDMMVHSSFYYPLDNGSQTIVDRLAAGLNIKFNTPIFSIKKTAGGQFTLNDSYKSEIIVYCGDVRDLSHMILTDDTKLRQALDAVSQLQANGTSNVFCECDRSNTSWLYLPEKNTLAHRVINTGVFSPNNNKGVKSKNRMTCVVEFSGKLSEREMLTDIDKLPGNPTPLDVNFAPASYVVQDRQTRSNISRLKEKLEPSGLFLLGRFAEWEYYNMDACIASALQVKQKVERCAGNRLAGSPSNTLALDPRQGIGGGEGT